MTYDVGTFPAILSAICDTKFILRRFLSGIKKKIEICLSNEEKKD